MNFSHEKGSKCRHVEGYRSPGTVDWNSDKSDVTAVNKTSFKLKCIKNYRKEIK